MKNSFRILSACLAASLAFVSCDKESLTKSDNGASKEGARVVTVSFSHTTKSDLGADGLTPHFTDGDVIKVFSGQNKEDCTVSVGNDGTATISIKSDELKTGTLTAVYPASAWSNSEPYFKVLTEQDGTFAKANICTATIPDDVKKVEFVNQTAILKFYVDNSIGVKKIEIDGTGVATSGDKITVTPASGETLYNVGGGPDPRICYAAVLPVSGTEITLNGTATTQNQKRLIPNATLAANTIYNAFIPYYIEVDLGEGKIQKWGYCNVGAFFPEDYGQYFMWGETTGITPSGNTFTFPDTKYYSVANFSWDTSKGFSWNNCPYTNGVYSTSNNRVFTKYVPSAKSEYWGGTGSADNKDTLDLEDDAAFRNWGGAWRMPTISEFETFISGASYTSGNFVYKGVTFPAAGGGSGTSLSGAGGNGYYWSSSLNTGGPFLASDLFFVDGRVEASSLNRYFGLSVRPLSE